MADQNPGISWTVLTHVHEPRSVDWYWALGLFATAGAGLCIYFSNILLAFILVIGAASIGFLAARGPREHSVRIDTRGVTIDGTLYPYDVIVDFSIGEHNGALLLILSVHSMLTPHIVMPLEGTSPDMIRMTLRRYCEEKEFQPRLVDSLAELMGL